MSQFPAIMLALFPDAASRDHALERASDMQGEIIFSGQGTMCAGGLPMSNGHQSACILFRACNVMDPFVFMQSGASSCTPL